MNSPFWNEHVAILYLCSCLDDDNVIKVENIILASLLQPREKLNFKIRNN